jgi:hypothetical protein
MFGKTVGSALRSPRPPSTTMISKSSVEKPRFVRSVRKTSHSPSLSERAIRKSPWARLCIDGTPPARRAERILERQLDPEGDPEGGSRVLQDIRADVTGSGRKHRCKGARRTKTLGGRPE